MPQTLYLVRHGETEWNRTGRRQGQLDSPLTDRGLAQAREQASVLSDSRIGAVFSSPLGRAYKTAEIMGGILGVPVEVLPELAEVHHGAYAGRRSSQLALRPRWWSRRRNLYNWTFPRGESYRDGDRRAAAALNAIQSSTAEVVLVVSHEMIERMLVRNLCGWDTDRALTLVHPHGVTFRWDEGASDIATAFD